jgi:hypothetical protein
MSYLTEHKRAVIVFHSYRSKLLNKRYIPLLAIAFLKFFSLKTLHSKQNYRTNLFQLPTLTEN